MPLVLTGAFNLRRDSLVLQIAEELNKADRKSNGPDRYEQLIETE